MAAILCPGDWRGAHLSVTILLVSLFARADAFHSAAAMRAMVPQGGVRSPGLCSRPGGAAALCRAPLREACESGLRMHQGQDKNNGGDGNFDERSMGRRRALHALGAGALAVIGFKADRAEAGYGSAAGGVVSNPLVKDTDLEQFFKLDPDVQYKIQKSLNGKVGRNQIKRLLGEIQALPPPTTIEEIDKRLEVIQTLKEEESISQLDFDKLREEERKIQKEKTYMQLTEKIKERKERMEKERQLQEALEAREKLLNALDAQPPWVSFGAAAGGSAISTLIMHPVDTIKVRLQAGETEEGEGSSDSHGGGHGQGEHAPLKPSSQMALEAPESPLVKFKESLGGVASLYEGVLPNIAKEAPSSALYLGIYEAFKATLTNTPLAAYPLLIYLAAGALGEFAANFYRPPVEAIKIAVQGSGMSVVDATKSVLGTDTGRKATIRAWTAALWRDIPMGAVQIALFEGIKTFIIESPDLSYDVNTLAGEAIIGSFAGFVAAAITVSPDLIVTKINLESRNGREVGISEVAKEIYDEQGLKGLTAGVLARSVYWGPAIGIFLSCYCSIRQYFLTI